MGTHPCQIVLKNTIQLPAGAVVLMSSSFDASLHGFNTSQNYRQSIISAPQFIRTPTHPHPNTHAPLSPPHLWLPLKKCVPPFSGLKSVSAQNAFTYTWRRGRVCLIMPS